MLAMSAVYIQQRVWCVTRSHDLWHVLHTLKRTITKSTLLHVIEGITYLCALCRCIAPGACVTSTTSSSCCLCCVSFETLDQLGCCLGLSRSGTPGWASLFFCWVATIDRRKGEGVDRRSQVTNSVVLLELCVHATNKCKLHHNPSHHVCTIRKNHLDYYSNYSSI